MKKIVFFAPLFMICTIISAQNVKVNDELPHLRKQVSSLKIQNGTLEKKIQELEQTSKNNQKELAIQIADCKQKIATLQDSLTAGKELIMAAKSRTDMIFHSLKLRKKLVLIFVPLLLIVLVLIYWQLSIKIKTGNDKNETLALNVKRTLEEEIANAKKEIQDQLGKQKEDFDRKIAEVKK